MWKKLIALMLAMLMVVYNITFAANEDITTNWVGEWDEEIEDILNDAASEELSGTETPEATWDVTSDTALETTWSTTSGDMATGWGYKDTDLITATATSDTVILKSPVLKDNAGNNILSYKVKYGTKSFAEPIDTTSGTSDVKELVANYQLSGTILVPTEASTDYSGTETEINITVPWLTAWTTYYAIIYPQNAESLEWTPAKEVMFQTAAAHEAAGATGWDIDARADVKGTKVTVTWTPAEWAKTVQIQYPYDPEGKNTKKLADVPMTDGKFTFDLGAGTWDSIVKVLALNAVGEQVWRDYQLTLKPNAETPIKAPKVWPESTLLMWLMVLAILLYITYRVRKIEKA